MSLYFIRSLLRNINYWKNLNAEGQSEHRKPQLTWHQVSFILLNYNRQKLGMEPALVSLCCFFCLFFSVCTCRNPLGSFSLITSRQNSIIPVVCRSFMVQWVIWSFTVWNREEMDIVSSHTYSLRNRHSIKHMLTVMNSCCECHIR